MPVTEQETVAQADPLANFKVRPGRPLPVKNRLFVYGIFLGEANRNHYGMSNPQYCTVPGYITVGSHIVQAVPVENPRIALTGLTVDIEPENWESLDNLEGGYDRILVETINHEEVYMYVQPKERFRRY